MTPRLSPHKAPGPGPKHAQVPGGPAVLAVSGFLAAFFFPGRNPCQLGGGKGSAAAQTSPWPLLRRVSLPRQAQPAERRNDALGDACAALTARPPRPEHSPRGGPRDGAAPAATMPRAPGLCALWLCAALCAPPCAPQPSPGPAACPALCHCQEDGVMLSADCSELGLSAVPGDLAPLTAYL